MWSGGLLEGGLLLGQSRFEGLGVRFGGDWCCVGRNRHHTHAQLVLDLLLDLVAQRRVVLEELAGVFLALSQLIALVGIPSAGLLDEAVLDAHVDDAALFGDTESVHDVELGLLEGGRHLVLDNLDSRAVTDRVGSLLEGLDSTNVQPHRRVELQRLATRSRLGRSEEHADLLAQLIDKDRRGAGAVSYTHLRAHETDSYLVCRLLLEK